MSRTVFCQKLKQKAEGLDVQPYPGPLGQKIFESVSKVAWKEWLGQQTMLINEHRLNPLDPQARNFLEQEMQKFLL